MRSCSTYFSTYLDIAIARSSEIIFLFVKEKFLKLVMALTTCVYDGNLIQKRLILRYFLVEKMSSNSQRLYLNFHHGYCMYKIKN